jgi:hypothetical protein
MTFQGDIFVAIRQSVPQAGKSVGIDVGINAPDKRGDTNNMALTDIAIRQTKPRPKPFKLTDGAGLHLLVAPTGARLWRLAYRRKKVPSQTGMISIAKAPSREIS